MPRGIGGTGDVAATHEDERGPQDVAKLSRLQPVIVEEEYEDANVDPSDASVLEEIFSELDWVKLHARELAEDSAGTCQLQ